MDTARLDQLRARMFPPPAPAPPGVSLERAEILRAAVEAAKRFQTAADALLAALDPGVQPDFWQSARDGYLKAGQELGDAVRAAEEGVRK